MMPVGILSGTVSAKEVRLTIFPLHGSGGNTVITLKLGWEEEEEGKGSVTGTFTGLQTFSLSGKVKSKLLPDGATSLAIKLFRDYLTEFVVLKVTYDKGPVLAFLCISIEIFPLQTGISST